MLRSSIYLFVFLALVNKMTVDPRIPTSLYVINGKKSELTAIVISKGNVYQTIRVTGMDTVLLLRRWSSGWLSPCEIADKISIYDTLSKLLIDSIPLNRDCWSSIRGPEIKWYYHLQKRVMCQ